MWRYAGKNSATLSGAVITAFILFKALKYSVIVGEAFGEVAFMITLTGIMFLPMITLLLMVVIHDAIIKKRKDNENHK
jgi:hypothetical protein|nr:MAG TPA: hypothetical protein [Caudoviricetes sp.]